jgi:hypothetical protein
MRCACLRQMAMKLGEPLLAAAASGNTAVMRELILKGADPNFRDKSGWLVCDYARTDTHACKPTRASACA